MRANLLLALVAGCVIPDLDPRGRACPCAVGWRCDTTGRCVEDLDAGANDGAAPAVQVANLHAL
jgi:hypothetical protein